jgi:hypothetical protein
MNFAHTVVIADARARWPHLQIVGSGPSRSWSILACPRFSEAFASCKGAPSLAEPVDSRSIITFKTLWDRTAD